eukprot:CAMPEP_0196598342 /NCGR_PEP_ID=MMETSP1081-20130531/94265_1 /TAXON_ID=36882 /ORGANISM="Pyramimonas amylifera, Strain CCMP720" /LENGTH=1870 /DNA_ID=CAMNT_0041924027 /DNA_START=155 /DNA_END=5767 /DNA_ORIENTATION=+
MAEKPPAPFTARKSSKSQFLAVLQKNRRLKTRGNLLCCTIVEIIVPTLFFAVLCLPKALIEQTYYNDEFYSETSLQSSFWTLSCTEGHLVSYVPNSEPARDIARDTVRHFACDGDPSTAGGTFFQTIVECSNEADNLFAASMALAETEFGTSEGSETVSESGSNIDENSSDESNAEGEELVRVLGNERFCSLCQNNVYGVNKNTCDAILDVFIQGFETESEAATSALRPENQGQVLAILLLPDIQSSSDDIRYTVRMNGTVMDSDYGRFSATKFVEKWDAVEPSDYWRRYHDFVNIQNAVDQALITAKVSSLSAPVSILAAIKPFPWINYSVNLGGAIAAAFFPMIFIFAFISTVTMAMKSVVGEKELRLREGMQMMGLSDSLYWGSWFISHWVTLELTMAIATLISLYSMSYTSGGLMFIYLFFWSISLIFFCYFMSCFFDRSQMASIIGSLIYVGGLAPALAVNIEQPNGGSGWVWVCLHPACAVYMWGEVLGALEGGQLGITSETWNTSVTSKGHFSAHTVFSMTIIDCFLYAILAWYFDKVWPSALGVKLKPWFLFTVEYWQSVGLISKPTDETGRKRNGDEDVELGARGASKLDMEPLSNALEASAAIRVRNLVKHFGEVHAVNGLTLTFANNQISTLLGHNGAGKTTTMQMLTGMLEPTSGEAFIDGKDIHTEMLAIRQSLGVCPQFDILWPNLTVKEHLELYANFQGVPAASVQAEILKMAVDVGLEEKFKDAVETLSGGQKRKLSMGIAFLGNPKVVFLDEPTSGMDPFSRRNTWEVIRRFKEGRAIILTTHFMDEADLLSDRIAIILTTHGRAIILTTHFMDEADLLSDRIAIMSAGQLACVGSSVFLRNRFSLGYTLTLTKLSDKAASLPVESFIHKHIPAATLLANVGTELSFKLPNNQTSKFSSFLESLEGSLDDLQVGSYGLSNTTLEEVFLKIAEGKSVLEAKQNIVQQSSHSFKPEEKPQERAPELEAPLVQTSTGPAPSAVPSSNQMVFVSGGVLMLQQTQALFMKRFLNMRRDKMALFTQYIGPVIFIIVALVTANLEFVDDDIEFDSVLISRDLIVALVTANLEFVDDDIEFDSVLISRDLVDKKPFSLGMSTSAGVSTNQFSEIFNLDDLTKTDRTSLAVRSCFCPTSEQEYMDDLTQISEGLDSSYTGYASKSKGECVELSDKITTTPTCQDYLTTTLDHFLLSTQEARTSCQFEDGSCDALFVKNYDVDARIFNHTVLSHPTAFHSLAVGINSANSAIFRLLGGKGNIYVTNHPMDMIPDDGEADDDGNIIQNLIVAIFVGFAISVLSASFSTFLVWERMNNAKHLQMVSGVHKLLFWVTAYLSDFLNYLVPMVVIIIVFAAFNIDEFVKEDGLGAIALLLLFFGLSSIPLAYLLHFPFRTPMNCLVAQMSLYMFLSMSTIIVVVVLELVGTSDALDVFDALKWVFRALPHYCMCRGVFDVAENYRLRQRGEGEDAFHMDVIGYHVLFMAIESVVFYLLTLLLEFNEARLAQRGAPASVAEGEDEDVVAEQRRILQGDGLEDEVVVVKGLAKTYPNGNAAVRPLSFSIGRGQCFGLLGVNGAGKTSTFRMLTGEFHPSAGDATVRGRKGIDGKRPLFSISKDLEAARTVMGYCPQFDGIQPNMTAREHLRFYALIRGVPSKDIPGTVDDLLQRMDLTRYADRQAGRYSGGNKRKLSVGIALVGDPPVVLLDEPSTGMDPEARRFMWDVISTTMQNRCVILTSHSMEECEALCHKVGIMVKGQFRCFGSIQHLKNRFSQGYTLEFSMQAENQPKVKAQVANMFPQAELVEEHNANLKYQVRGAHMLPKLFGAIEESAQGGKLFDDYSISQTTLEQVFVRFAADDEDPQGQ